jgi:hypothetical protein
MNVYNYISFIRINQMCRALSSLPSPVRLPDTLQRNCPKGVVGRRLQIGICIRASPHPPGQLDAQIYPDCHNRCTRRRQAAAGHQSPTCNPETSEARSITSPTQEYPKGDHVSSLFITAR